MAAGRDVAINGITERSVEQLSHIDQLVDETHGARFFTKLDLAMAYMQFRIREEGRCKTSFRVLAASTSSTSAPLACTVCCRA